MKIRDDAGTVIETYTYGVDRKRLVREGGSTRTYFAWGGSSPNQEYSESTSATNPVYAKSYVYAGTRLLSTATNTGTGTTVEFHHPDRLGTKLVTKPSANTYFEQSTMPFGTAFGTESSGATNQRFTSYDRNESTKLDYALNRTYSPGMGRFTQVDPIGISSSDSGSPQSLNLISYVQSNPVDNVDPSGLFISSYGYQPPEEHLYMLEWFQYLWFLQMMLSSPGGGGDQTASDSGGGAPPAPGTQGKPPKSKCKQADNKPPATAHEVNSYMQDAPAIIEKLKAAGVWDYIDQSPGAVKVVGEGITFTVTDFNSFKTVLDANPNFRHRTPFGGAHASTVGASLGSVSDYRSFTSGSQTLGPDSVSGITRSLQIDLGVPGGVDVRTNRATAQGYADLDCENPAQDVWSAIGHAKTAIGNFFNRR